MTPFAIVALVLLSLATIVHLVYCFLAMRKPRVITKLFLMPLLLVFLIALGLNHPMIIIAIIMGWIGDFFLIYKDNKVMLSFGFIAFISGHFLYIATLFTLLATTYPWWLYLVIFIPLALVFTIGAFTIVKRLFRSFSYISSAYAFILTVVLSLGILLLIKQYSLGAIFIIIGATLFISSDAYLGYTIFLKPYLRENFYIMLLYMGAQVFLGLGFWLLLT